MGTDFVRKGGDLLLEVFRERLRHKAELVLVTRAHVAEEPGVRVYGTIAPNSQALLELYRSADIFALPTRADCYSHGRAWKRWLPGCPSSPRGSGVFRTFCATVKPGICSTSTMLKRWATPSRP